jgi:hypothetical protein
MAILKLGGLALAGVLGSALLMGQAAAMPANGLMTVADKVGNSVQEVRWIGGGWRGGWRGGFGWRGGGVAWRGGWNGGWGRNWGRGLYAYAGPGWRGGGMGWRGGWNGGWGRNWGRGLYAYAGPAPGWRMGWRRPALAAATMAAGVGLAAAAWDSSYYDNTYNAYSDAGWNTGWNQPTWANNPYYASAGPTWAVGYNPGWGWRGWGFRRAWW